MASGNRVPEQMTTLAPILKTPLTDTFNIPLSQQGLLLFISRLQFAVESLLWPFYHEDQCLIRDVILGRVCGFFEAQFYKCMEAYGAKLGRKYCDLEHRDFQECMTSDKQQKVCLFFL